MVDACSNTCHRQYNAFIWPQKTLFLMSHSAGLLRLVSFHTRFLGLTARTARIASRSWISTIRMFSGRISVLKFYIQFLFGYIYSNLGEVHFLLIELFHDIVNVFDKLVGLFGTFFYLRRLDSNLDDMITWYIRKIFAFFERFLKT